LAQGLKAGPAFHLCSAGMLGLHVILHATILILSTVTSTSSVVAADCTARQRSSIGTAPGVCLLQGSTSGLEKVVARRSHQEVTARDADGAAVTSVQQLSAFLNNTHESTLLLKSVERRLASEATLSGAALHKAEDTVTVIARHRGNHVGWLSQATNELQQILGQLSTEGTAERQQAEQEMHTAQLLQNAVHSLEEVQDTSLVQGATDSKALQGALEAAFEALAASATETAERAESSVALEGALQKVVASASSALEANKAEEQRLQQALGELRQAEMIQEKEKQGVADSGRSLIEEALNYSQDAEKASVEGALNVASVGKVATEMRSQNSHLQHELDISRQKNAQLSDYLQSLAQYVQGAAKLVKATQLSDSDQEEVISEADN